MKRCLSALSCALLLCMAGVANAEHKLLITDVLEAKQVEAEASFYYRHSTYDFLNRSIPMTGKVTTNTSGSGYSLGVGLGHGLQVSASIPYVFSKNTKYDYDVTPSTSRTYKEHGFGDLAISAKYRLLDEASKPFTLVTAVGVKLDTAKESEAGTGTTDISPYLAFSKTVKGNLRPYAVYRATIRNHGAADTHSLTGGVEKEMNKTITVLAELSGIVNTASDLVGSSQAISATIASYLKLYGNLYLIPEISAGATTSAERKDANVRLKPMKSISGTVSVYYLF